MVLEETLCYPMRHSVETCRSVWCNTVGKSYKLNIAELCGCEYDDRIQQMCLLCDWICGAHLSPGGSEYNAQHTEAYQRTNSQPEEKETSGSKQMTPRQTTCVDENEDEDREVNRSVWLIMKIMETSNFFRLFDALMSFFFFWIVIRY